MVDVPDRPDVQVRFIPNEFFFGHLICSSSKRSGVGSALFAGRSYHAPRIRSSIVSVI
jgi:hypothetical protein